LSIRRAESVKAYLVNAGIDAAIIRIEGHGETQPISSNATKTGRQQNRRVEVTLQ
jgi:OOP family OmpA-OmpF porin